MRVLEHHHYQLPPPLEENPEQDPIDIIEENGSPILGVVSEEDDDAKIDKPATEKQIRKVWVELKTVHSDAEKAGVKGISKARSLARANFQAEDDIFNSSLIKERISKRYS